MDKNINITLNLSGLKHKGLFLTGSGWQKSLFTEVTQYIVQPPSQTLIERGIVFLEDLLKPAVNLLGL